jgi:hypothetical protein
VEVVHIEVRRTTIPRKLHLNFHLVRFKGNVAHRTRSTDPRTTPQPVRVAIRELALFDGFASFNAEETFVWHKLIPRGIRSGKRKA